MPLLKLSDVVVDGVKFTVTTALNGNLHFTVVQNGKKPFVVDTEWKPDMRCKHCCGLSHNVVSLFVFTTTPITLMSLRPYLQAARSFCAHPHPTFVKNVKSYSSSSSSLFPVFLLGKGRTSSLHNLPRRFFSSSSPPFLRYQTPAPRPSRRPLLNFLNNIPHNVVFYGIMGLNSSVFMMWFLALEKYKQEKDPSTLIWMEQNFTNSWKNLSGGRIWTPLAACFSHKDLFHIFLNTFTFFFMARPVLHLLGSRQFIFLYMGGGLCASFSSLLYSQWAQRDNYCSHGASGAIYSIVSLLACVAPKMTFQLYGFIPVPAWLAVAGLFSYDLYSTAYNKAGKTDTVGHIGGILAGISYFLFKYFRIM